MRDARANLPPRILYVIGDTRWVRESNGKLNEDLVRVLRL